MTQKRIMAVPGGTAQTPMLAVEDDDSGGAPAAHAPTHTSGLDQIANAVSGGAAGLMQGSDKDKLDRLASPVAAPLNYILFANGGGASVWAPNALHIDNILTVGSGTDADYSNIHDAVDAAVAGGAGPTDWWLIQVYPGIYTEAKTTVPPGVVVSAVSGVRSQLCDVRPTNPLDDLFIMTGGVLTNLYLSGVTDALHACVRAATAGTISRVQQCRIGGPTSNGIWIEGGATVVMPVLDAAVVAAAQAIDRVVYVEGAGSTLLGSTVAMQVTAAVLALYPGVDPIRRALHVENGAAVALATSAFDIAHNTANQAAVEAGAGAVVTLFSPTIRYGHTGILINAGAGGTLVNVLGGFITGCDTYNWNIQSATAQLFFSGVLDDHVKRNAVAGAVECSSFQESSSGITETYGPVEHEYTEGRAVEITRFVAERHSSVVGLGGVTITDEGGLDISVTAGTGWVHRPAAPNRDADDVAWGHQHHTLTDNATNYVYVDATTQAIAHGVVAPGADDILLFEVLTAGGDIRFMHAVWTNGVSRCKLLEDYLRATRRVMLNTGLAATINADPHYWDLGGGSYYYGLLLETITGGAQYPFLYFYGAGGASTLTPTGGNHVDLLQYDNGGALAALGAGSYRADTLFITSDGKASVILGNVDHGAGPGGLAAAVAAAPAAAPLFLYPTVFIVAKIIVLQATGIAQIDDLRTTATTTVAPGAADHNTLANLTAPNDAHTQYVHVDGRRAMTGDLDMSANDITNVTTVDGVDVSDHSARHDPGGADELTQGLPTPIQVGDAQAQGGAASFANSAHVHAVTAGVPVAVGTANAIGAAATTCHSDHVHAGLTRGAGDFATFPLKAVTAAADVLILEDSAAAGAKKYTTVSAVATAATIFGQNYQTAISLARSTTSSGVFQTKTTLTTPALTGTYRIGWACDIDVENNNRAVRTRLYNSTDLVAVGAELQDRLATTAGIHFSGGFDYVTFAGAAKTFVLQYYSVDGGVVGIRNARIELWRVT